MHEIRSPIVAVLGHVDHGKTSILDAIRGSRVAAKEAGGITQMIGASYVSKQDIENLSSGLAEKLKIKLVVPGLLFIDTPGHEAFTNLRDRGGSIADIAILVVDVNEGFMPQTIESINILKRYKTPFVIAANKIDILSGWNKQNTKSFLESLGKQREDVKLKLDEKIYSIVAKLGGYGFNSERFDRVGDFSKEVAIIPISAKTHEGLAELLLLVAGLSQKYLEKELYINRDEPAKGSIIEVKEEKGMGTTIDAIIYDGVLKTGDEFYFLTNKGVKKTKIRALLLPNVRGGEKYTQVEKIVAAAGVKIIAPELDGAIPGSPFAVVGASSEEEMKKQLTSIVFEKSEVGVYVKTDSLGSAEALIALLKEHNIPIAKVNIGSVSKEDVLFSKSISEKNKYLGVILAFNTRTPRDVLRFAEDEKVRIIENNIIYRLVENYESWVEEEKEKEKREMFLKLGYPARIKFLPGCCFRLSKPAVFGVEILDGKIKPGAKIMDKEGNVLGEIKGVQEKKEVLNEACKGMQVAISVDEIVVNKDICEGDILYTYLTQEEIEMWKEREELLTDDAKFALEEIKKIILKKRIEKK
ncbi:MAG: translation initiation factor IF-2 [Candidatus Anstonellales archaeon]